MDDSVLYQTWYLWLAIAAVLIIAAATLLLMVNAAARRILKLATAALALVVKIKGNTTSIWELENTNRVASDILNGAKQIDDHLDMVSSALHELDKKK